MTVTPNSFAVRRLKQLKLLREQGKALDLGCGNGEAAQDLIDYGYLVDAVDIDKEKTKHIPSSERLNIHNTNIKNFSIPSDTYDIVIARNVLPFIDNKGTVEQIITNCVAGLKEGGVLLFTLFGPRDAWSARENMTFYSYEEALAILKKHLIKPVHLSTEEGWGPKMDGELKYWHVHRFTYQK